jgi:hypothetical protein
MTVVTISFYANTLEINFVFFVSGHSVMASVFYRTVRTFGCKAYTRGQKRGCMCVHEENGVVSEISPQEVVAMQEEQEKSKKKGGGFLFNSFSRS